MIRIIYSLILTLLLPVMVLRLLLKGIKNRGYAHKIGNRFGFIDTITKPVICIHCVSVGEFIAASVVIDEIIKKYPSYKVVITTTTATGFAEVVARYKDSISHFYFPFDVPFIVNLYINRLNPKLFILLETEVWPNLLHALNKKNIATLLINARLSVKSYKNYSRFSSFSRQTLNNLSMIAAQNNNSAKRFAALGVSEDKIIVSGNIKFDLQVAVDENSNKQLRNIIGGRKVVVFASTHKGEEASIINSYKQNQDIEALLVIIPRHPERFNEVYKLAKSSGFSVARRSDNKPCLNTQILIGDSMGEMMTYFNICDIAFIGGSLVEVGGHNMLEAAAFSKPIIFGSNVFNFAEIADSLLTNNGAIQVQNAQQLFSKIKVLLNAEGKCFELGNNAKRYFISQQGALTNTMDLIDKALYCDRH